MGKFSLISFVMQQRKYHGFGKRCVGKWWWTGYKKFINLSLEISLKAKQWKIIPYGEIRSDKLCTVRDRRITITRFLHSAPPVFTTSFVFKGHRRTFSHSLETIFVFAFCCQSMMSQMQIGVDTWEMKKRDFYANCCAVAWLDKSKTKI